MTEKDVDFYLSEMYDILADDFTFQPSENVPIFVSKDEFSG